jgi:hypothetical protein
METNVIVYRDFIDAFMSYYRVQTDQSDYYVDDIKEIYGCLNGPLAKDGPYIIYIRNLFWYANRLKGRLLLEYETDIIDEHGKNRYEHLVSKIGLHFRTAFTEKDINRVSEYCDISINKKRGNEQGAWRNVNREHNIHGRHVYGGVPGNWRSHVNNYIENFLCESELNKLYHEWQKIVGK